jgi:hypothetical protein
VIIAPWTMAARINLEDHRLVYSGKWVVPSGDEGGGGIKLSLRAFSCFYFNIILRKEQ